MKCFCFCGDRSERQCASILGRLSARMNRPPGLVYSSALFSSCILSPCSATGSTITAEGLSLSREWQVLRHGIFPSLLILPSEGKMKQSEHFLEKAENRARLADQAADEPPTTHWTRRGKRLSRRSVRFRGRGVGGPNESRRCLMPPSSPIN
jgi:hypothetical protein